MFKACCDFVEVLGLLGLFDLPQVSNKNAFLYSLGDLPVIFLKISRKLIDELISTSPLISSIDRSDSASSTCALRTHIVCLYAMALAGQKTEIDLKNLYVRDVRIIGSTLRSRTPEVKAQIFADLVKDVSPKIEAERSSPRSIRSSP